MQEATAQGAQATGELLRKQNLREVAQQIPGALQSGDLSQIAGQAYGAGDPTLLREALSQQTELAKAAAKPQDRPLTGTMLRNAFPGMTDEWYQAAELAGSRDQQRQEFAAISAEKGRQGQSIDRDLDRQLRETNQREQSRERFTKSIEGNLKKYRENMESFERLADLDPTQNVNFWPQVSTIIKKVGMDAGALSDQDMARFIASTGQRTLTQALQYVGAIDPSKTSVPPQIIDSVQQTINKMKSYSEQKLKERAQAELKKQVKVRGERLDDDLVKELALDYGFVADKKDGKWQFGDEIELSKTPVSVETRGAGADVKALIGRLSPEQKAAAEKKLAEFAAAKKPVSDAFIQKLRELAGGQ